MTLIKRNNSLLFPSLLDEIFKPDWNGGIQNTAPRFPAVNIRETELDFKLELVAPGLKKEDFIIEIDQKTLAISSTTTTDTSEQTDKYARRDYVQTSFSRNFDLPNSVDSEKIEANYENGILFMTLPKREEALPKPKRVIEIG